MEYCGPLITTRRLQFEDLTKVKKSICKITGESGHPYQLACAVRASLVNGESRENNYFIVTLNTASLPIRPCIRRYGWKVQRQCNVSIWNQQISISGEPKTATRGFSLFTVDKMDGQFLDVGSKINKYDIELTAYFVLEKKLEKLHFYRNKKSKLFTPDRKEEAELSKNSVKPLGAPVVNQKNQIVGLLNGDLTINFFYVKETRV